MRILVSACLMGLSTRYDGGHCENEELKSLGTRHTLNPVCPEQLGGLPTPRVPCERVGEAILSKDGADHTAAFNRGAAEAFKLYKLSGCAAAVLKARSPSCGKGPIYDGSFTGKLTDRAGVYAKNRLEAGSQVASHGFRSLFTGTKRN